MHAPETGLQRRGPLSAHLCLLVDRGGVAGKQGMGLINREHLVLGKLGMAALTMECSTVPLSVHIALRQVTAFPRANEAAKALFAVLFLLFRVIFFGGCCAELLLSVCAQPEYLTETMPLAGSD